jgi:hypothetical protein
MAKRLNDNIRSQVTNPVVPILDTDGKGTYNLSPIGFPSVDKSNDLVPTLYVPNFISTYNNANSNIVPDKSITVNVVNKSGIYNLVNEELKKSVATYDAINKIFSVQYNSHGLSNNDIVEIKDYNSEIDGQYTVIKLSDDEFQFEYSGAPSGETYTIWFANTTPLNDGEILDLSNQSNEYDNGLWYVGENEWQNITELSVSNIKYNTQSNIDVVSGTTLSFDTSISSITSNSSLYELVITTSSSHGLCIGTDITISSTTNFNGNYKVKDILSLTKFSVAYESIDYATENTGNITYQSQVGDVINVKSQTNDIENGIYVVHVTAWNKIATIYTYDGTENDNKFAIYYDGLPINNIELSYNGKCVLGKSLANHELNSGDLIEIVSDNGYYDGIFIVKVLSDTEFTYELNTWDIPSSIGYANKPLLDKDGDVYDHFRNGYSHKELAKFVNTKLALALTVAKVNGPLHRWLVDLVDVNFGASGTQSVVIPAFPVSDVNYSNSSISSPTYSNISYDRGNDFNTIYEKRKSRKELISKKRESIKKEKSFAKWVLPAFNSDGEDAGEDKSATLRMYPESYNKEYNTDDILGGGHIDGDVFGFVEDDLRFYISNSHSDLRPFSDSAIFYQKNNGYHHNIILDSSDENMFGAHSINLVNNLRDVDTSINSSILTLLDDMVATDTNNKIIIKSTVNNVTKYLYKKRSMHSIEDFHLDTFTLDWSSSTTYDLGDYAYLNGFIYESKIDSNNNISPDSDLSAWRKTTIIRYSELSNGVLLDIEGELTVTIEDSTLNATPGNIVEVLRLHNDIVPGVINGESPDELDCIFVDNSLQDQLNNASGAWSQERNYQKKAFIHLPTDGVDDGKKIDLKVTLPIKDPSLGTNFNQSTIGMLNAYKSYVTQPRVYVLSGYQSIENNEVVDKGMPEKYNDYSYSKMPEMEFISEDSVFNQRVMSSDDLIGNGDVVNKDRRTLCAVIYPTTTETFSWRMDKNPRLKLLKEYLYNFTAFSGSASHVAYRRNQLTSYGIPELANLLDISTSEFALSYKYGSDPVFGYSTYTLNKNSFATNVRTYMLETLIPSEDDLLSDEVRSTYGSFVYQANSSFNKLISDFYSMRVAFDEVVSDNNVQKFLGHSNTTTSVPSGFFDGVIQTNSVEYPTQNSDINDDRWLSKPLYTPEYIVEASDTLYPLEDPYSSVSNIFKNYMNSYYGDTDEESNSGDRYVYGTALPTFDTEYAFGRSGDNVIIDHLINIQANDALIKDVKRKFWESSLNKTVDNSLYFLDKTKHRKYDYYNLGGSNTFPEYNSAFYGFYWNSFSNIISMDGIKPGSHDVELMISQISGDSNLESTLYSSLESNPIVSHYIESGDKFVSMNTSSSNSHKEEFLRNYIVGYSNRMPIRFYNSYRVLLQGDATSTSHADEETNRIFKYSVTDYLNEFVDTNDANDVQRSIDDLIAVEEINQVVVKAEDVNVSWGYFDDGNGSPLSDLITVSGNQYLFNTDFYNDLSKYSYIRVSIELVYSKCSGRWLTLGYRQTPVSYLTPTIGNVALSTKEKSIILPSKKGDSVDDYALVYQPDIDNTFDVLEVVSEDIETTTVTIDGDINSGINTYNVGDKVYFYLQNNLTQVNGLPNIDTLNSAIIESIDISTNTELVISGQLYFDPEQYVDRYVKFTKEINTIERGTYPRSLTSGSEITDYLWKDTNCMGDNVYEYLYRTPYHRMNPMELNYGSIPFLSNEFPYNNDGSIKSFYNPNGEYNYQSNTEYRNLILNKLYDNASISYVIPNNNSGGESSPMNVYDFMPHLWKTYWHRRPVISSYKGTDVPSLYTRSGGDISDPVLGSMFPYLDLRDWEISGVQYQIPYHRDMSLNWLQNGYVVKDANFISTADDRTTHDEFDANFTSTADDRATFDEYDANRHGGQTYQNQVVEVVTDSTDQAIITDTVIVNGLANYENRNYGSHPIIYSATDSVDYSTRTLLSIRLPDEVQGKEITSAKLILSTDTWETKQVNSTVFFNIHKMLVDWNEGSGYDASEPNYQGQVNNSEVNGATKTHVDSSDTWNVPFIGLDNSDASTTVYSSTSNNFGDSTTEFDITYLVSQWILSPASNYGIVIVNPDALDDQVNNPSNLVSYPKWCSSENPNSNLRPKLSITYKL